MDDSVTQDRSQPAEAAWVRCVVLALWVCCVLRLTFYAAAIPLWEGFDEYAHYARIEYLAVQGREPSRSTLVPMDVAATMAHVPTHNGGISYDEYWKQTSAERAAGFSFPPATIYEAQQPPLFYWLMAALYRMTGGLTLAAHVLLIRLVCVLLASLCVPVGFGIARRALGDSIQALGASALIAALPLFTFTTTHVTNDALAVALGTLVVWLALRGSTVPLALALTAALLTKAYFLAFLPVVALLLIFRKTRMMAAAALSAAVLLAGGWYWNNWTTTHSLTGNSILMQPGLGELARTLPQFSLLRAADFAWITLVWTGNWSFLVVRSWMYHLLAAVAAVALAGVILLLWKRRAAIALLAAFVASFAVALGYLALAARAVTGSPYAGGWYASCLAAPLAILLYAGLRAVLPRRVQHATAAILVIALAALELFGAHIYLLPYYAGLIAHLPSGRLPAFHLTGLANGGLADLFQRLSSYQPALATAPVLMTLWVLFVLATLALILISIRIPMLRPAPARPDAAALR